MPDILDDLGLVLPVAADCGLDGVMTVCYKYSNIFLSLIS